MNVAYGHGWTALFWAATNGHTGIVRALLAAPGLDVNATVGDGRTALIAAADKGHAETVKLI